MNKHLLKAALICGICGPLTAVAADKVHIVVPASYTGDAAISRQTLTLTPLAPLARSYSTNIFSRQPIGRITDTNGVAIFSNVLWGTYRLDIPGNPGTGFNLSVGTNLSGLVNVAVLITNAAAFPPNPATNYYNQAQVDALVEGARTGTATNAISVKAGARTTAGTNALEVTINADAQTNATLARLALTDAITNVSAGSNIVVELVGKTATIHSTATGGTTGAITNVVAGTSTIVTVSNQTATVGVAGGTATTADITNVVNQLAVPVGSPRNQNRNLDFIFSQGASGPEVAANGYWYRYSANTYSNVFYGGETAAGGGFIYTNAAGWFLSYIGDNNFYITNNTGTLMWHGARGSLMIVNNSNPWGYNMNNQCLWFPFGTKDGAVNAGPQMFGGVNIYTPSTDYAKVVVFEGDSRLDGWNHLDNYGSVWASKYMMGHPFFKNTYFTNFATSGNDSATVSNRYAGSVYPLRPRAGQVGYYVVWTGANGDTQTVPATTLQPLFKQAKNDGWIIVAVTCPATPVYGDNNGLTYGEDQFLYNVALRKLHGSSGYLGSWDILVDLEQVLHSLHDEQVSADRLHPYRNTNPARLGDYIGKRIAEGTAIDREMNLTPALAYGTFDKYGKTNVVLRTHPQYGNFLFKGAPLMAGDGFGITTNLPPAIPQSPGATFFWNSNGTATYQLVSAPDTQTWTATNLIASGSGAGDVTSAQLAAATNAASLPSSVNATNVLWSTNRVDATFRAWVESGAGDVTSAQLAAATNAASLPSSVNSTNALWSTNRVDATFHAWVNSQSAAGISDSTATNIAAFQAYLATNSFLVGLLSRDNSWPGSNHFSVFGVDTMHVGAFDGNGTGLTNAAGYGLAGTNETRAVTFTNLSSKFAGDGSGLTNAAGYGLAGTNETRAVTFTNLASRFAGDGSGLTNAAGYGLAGTNETRAVTFTNAANKFAGDGSGLNGLTNLNASSVTNWGDAAKVRIREDFLGGNVTSGAQGEMGWRMQSSGNALTYLNSTAGHPGIAHVATSASSNSVNATYLGQNDVGGFLYADGPFIATYVFRASTNTADFFVGMGAQITPGASLKQFSEGVYWAASSYTSVGLLYTNKASQLYLWTQGYNSSSPPYVSYTATSVTPQENVWFKFTLRWDGSHFFGAINGGSEIQFNTDANSIPNNTIQLTPVFSVTDGSTAAARFIDADFYSFEQTITR